MRLGVPFIVLNLYVTIVHDSNLFVVRCQYTLVKMLVRLFKLPTFFLSGSPRISAK
ncbi:hypothetical protein SBF1_2550011 [Candidatus Desulfosporosinus infrequens]|uniref:Uncharacterized protein n=1 Tax=Candidatus Desulfosporosinus infrequens TaxID=2043169 RepID=A0A2U3KPI3_9FIRM|nr:hypothetical protein SBF1_2550011 [Candidatus Desulfosporosinus infrequens]